MLFRTTYPNTAQDHVWILQKHRSRDFTFQFFKQNLKLKSIHMFRESCTFGYTEHNKIGFAIFGFFFDFLRILQGAAETQKGVKILITSRPLEDLKAHNHTLGLRQGPWKFLGPCNAVLKPGRRRNPPDSGDVAVGEVRWRGGGRWGTQP
jgi:hypothetical protein